MVLVVIDGWWSKSQRGCGGRLGGGDLDIPGLMS